MRDEARTRPSKIARLAPQGGFTLIELLVVILIISILAAISIPMFLRHRDRTYVAQVRSALRGAASAAQAAAIAAEGDYASLDQNVAALYDQGFKTSSGVAVGISADADSFCLAAEHELLPADNEWKTAGYDSSTGTAAPGTEICPEAAVLAAGSGAAFAVVPQGSGSEGSAPADQTNGTIGTTSGEGGYSAPTSPEGTATDGTTTSPGSTPKGGGSTKPKKPR